MSRVLRRQHFDATYRASVPPLRPHLVIVRHGESCANVATQEALQQARQGNASGVVDGLWKQRFIRQPLLTAKGVRQALDTGQWFVDHFKDEASIAPPTEVHSSVLPRAAMTAGFIAAVLGIKRRITVVESKDVFPQSVPLDRDVIVVKLRPHFEERKNRIDNLLFSGYSSQNVTTLDQLEAFLTAIHHVIRIVFSAVWGTSPEVYFEIPRVDWSSIGNAPQDEIEAYWRRECTEFQKTSGTRIIVSHGFAMHDFMLTQGIDYKFPNCGMILFDPVVTQESAAWRLNFKIQGAPPLWDSSRGEIFLWKFNLQDGFGSADRYEHVLLNCKYTYHTHIEPVVKTIPTDDRDKFAQKHRRNHDVTSTNWFYENWKQDQQEPVFFTWDAKNVLRTCFQTVTDAVSTYSKEDCEEDLQAAFAKPLPIEDWEEVPNDGAAADNGAADDDGAAESLPAAALPSSSAQ